MKPLLSLALLVLSSTLLVAQDTVASNCPSLSLTGPIGIANAGELTSYTVTVSNAEQYSLEYLWTVNALPIKDGQGTSSIRLIHQNVMLVVTVDVKGLPEGCPASASAACACDHAPILPVQLYELQPNEIFDKPAATRVAAVMLENPNNQLYILAGKPRRRDIDSRARFAIVKDLLSKNGIPAGRVTIATSNSDVESMAFWRVPPGATNPRCEECDEFEKPRKLGPGQENFDIFPSDEFGNLSLSDQKGRLDNFLNQLTEYPSNNGYVILQFRAGTPKTKIATRIEFLRNHFFRFRKFSESRIRILSEPSKRDATVLYLLPPVLGYHFCRSCELHD